MPDFKDGYQIELIGEAVFQSARCGNWVKIKKV